MLSADQSFLTADRKWHLHPGIYLAIAFQLHGFHLGTLKCVHPDEDAEVYEQIQMGEDAFAAATAALEERVDAKQKISLEKIGAR